MDALPNIKDEILVLKILHSIRNVKLEDIAPLIDSWIDIHEVDLWSKIDKLNFCYDAVSQKWLRNNPGYMKYDVIANKINKYQSLIFDFRGKEIISICDNKIIYDQKNEKEMKLHHYVEFRINNIKCEFEVSKQGMIKFKINSRDEITVTITNCNGYIQCEEKKYISMDIGYLHDGNYDIYISS